MEHAPGHVAFSGFDRRLAWRIAGEVVPAIAIALGAFLLFQGWTEDGGPPPSSAVVDPGHSGRLAANIAFFETRVAETPDHLSYNRLTALYLQRLRETGDASDLRRAEMAAMRSLAAAPGEYNGLVLMAQVKVAQHDFDAAGTLAREAIAAIPGRAEALAVLGDAQMALGDYAGAGDSYRAYLEKAPGPAAFSRRAALAEVEGDRALAEQFWRAAVEADRDAAPEASAWARVQLGHLLFATGETGAARDEYTEALRVFPGYGAASAGLGRVAAARGDYAEAAKRYREAAASLPLPEYVIALGDVLTRDGKQAEAQYALARAIGQLHEANGVRDDLTLILFELDHGGDLAAAAAKAAAGYRSRPSLAAADTYAWALHRTGQLEQARAKAEEAVRLGTPEPTYYFHAGAIAHAQGDYAAAVRYLGQAFALNPHFNVLHEREAARLLADARGRTR